MKRIFLFVIICFLGYTYSFSQEQSQTKEYSAFSIETNTTPWIFGGYAVGVNIKPKKWRRWGVLAGIAGNADFSPFIVDVFKPQNSDKNMDWEVSQAYVFAIDYYLKPDTNEGLYIGLFNFIFENELERNSLTAEFTSHTILARTGYRLYPFKSNGFYLNPWGGVGTEYSWDNNNQTIDGVEWETSDVAYFVSLNIGYTF